MAIMRMWRGSNHLHLVDDETGRDFDVFIMGATLLDPIELEELVLGEIEEFAKRCKQPLPPRKKQTKEERIAFGEVIVEIQESNRPRKEVGHGKYW